MTPLVRLYKGWASEQHGKRMQFFLKSLRPTTVKPKGTHMWAKTPFVWSVHVSWDTLLRSAHTKWDTLLISVHAIRDNLLRSECVRWDILLRCKTKFEIWLFWIFQNTLVSIPKYLTLPNKLTMANRPKNVVLVTSLCFKFYLQSQLQHRISINTSILCSFWSWLSTEAW